MDQPSRPSDEAAVPSSTKLRPKVTYVGASPGPGISTPRFLFVFLWVAVTVLGLIGGGWLAGLVGLNRFGQGTLTLLPFVTVIGGVIGIGQGLVLWSRLGEVGWWWFFANAVGCPTGLLVGIALSVLNPLNLVGAGTVIFLFQWLVLRRHVSYAGWWVLGNLALITGLLMLSYVTALLATSR